MKRSKIIAILCVVMLSALALAVFVSCDTTGVQYHYDYLVTFNYNVDNLKNDKGDPLETNCETEYLGVLADSKIVAPGKFGEQSIVFQEYEITGYFIEGWYTAELDSEGNPVKDENGNIVLKTKWNFDTDTVSANLTLYANLVKKLQFKIMTGEDSYVVIDGQAGRVIEQREAESIVKKDGWTFMKEIYLDEALTQKLTFPYILTDTEPVFTCYAKMMQGNWTFVDNTDDFLSALSLGTDIYINAAELDFADVQFRLPQSFTGKDPMTYFGKDFYGKIQGNGCVIKNLTFTMDCQRNVTSRYAFFKTLGEGSEITDITFQNVNIAVNVNTQTTSDFTTAFFAVEIEKDVKISNVTFNDCSFTLTGGTSRVLENLETTFNNNGYYYHSESSFDCFNAEELTVTNNIIQE